MRMMAKGRKEGEFWKFERGNCLPRLNLFSTNQNDLSNSLHQPKFESSHPCHQDPIERTSNTAPISQAFVLSFYRYHAFHWLTSAILIPEMSLCMLRTMDKNQFTGCTPSSGTYQLRTVSCSIPHYMGYESQAASRVKEERLGSSPLDDRFWERFEIMLRSFTGGM